MMRKLLPLFLILAGLGAGAGAGLALRPAPTADGHAVPGHDAAKSAGHVAQEGPEDHATAAASGKTESNAAADGHDEDGDPSLPDYVKLNNQFVVPLVEDGRVVAMVILSLSLEVAPGSAETVYAREPKLRDAFLQVMFDHANAGGFRGVFTDGSSLEPLRTALREMAVKTLGDTMSDVLIVDILRQDS